MSKLICTATLLLFAGTLFAESPMGGTWKLDAAKSKFSQGDLPKDVTLAIEQKGDDLQVSASGTNVTDRHFQSSTQFPRRGARDKFRQVPPMTASLPKS